MINLSRRSLLGGAMTIAVVVPAAAEVPQLEVWKQRACGCCKAWAKHFEAAGFSVMIHEVDDVTPTRRAAGVPDDLAGCHTARSGGYLIEGHVPVQTVQRLLNERPPIAGLAVPGMPIGSPGMEMEGQPSEPFDVVAFDPGGRRYVFTAVGG